MTKNRKDKKPARSWWRKLLDWESLQIMQLGTLMWLLVLVGFVAMTSQCAWQWDVPWYRVDLRYFSCRTTNELGDFLAGAFAPLAFLWLAGAVFIQASELSAQRDELKLSRAELSLQRTVLNEQANEAKTSRQLFERQTKVLENERKIRESEVFDNTFNVVAAELKARLSSDFRIEYIIPDAGEVENRQRMWVDLMVMDDDTLWDMLNSCSEMPMMLSNTLNSYDMEIDAKSLRYTSMRLSDAQESIVRLRELHDNCSDATKLTIRDVHLEGALLGLIKTYSMIQELNTSS